MKRSRRPQINQDIPGKTNRILYLVLIAMALILIRIWHLSVIQYDKKFEEARRPQIQSVIDPSTRATIRDRFNVPLAINKIRYQATILYSQMRDIPTTEWIKDANGKKVKHFKRKEYIRNLSNLLAEELGLEADRIEDLIYAKASFYAQVPYLIKDELSEKQYYRLKILEKDWPGLMVRKVPQRTYPLGRVAGDLIGYMGAINKQEYERILQEMNLLEQYIRRGDEESEAPKGIESLNHARVRLKALEEKAYSINDFVGKTGVEAAFEQQLRGFYGKRNYYSDSKGNHLREMPGTRPPLTGQRINLTISAELQEFAEQLLAQNEAFRVVRLSHLGPAKKTVIAQKHPWIKGGAIVAMDPKTGEVVAMASYPRIDPNDFVLSKNDQIHRWFESETYIAQLWNQQRPLERERYGSSGFYDEKQFLTGDTYLDFILPEMSPLRVALKKISTLGQALEIQREAEKLCSVVECNNLYAILNILYDGESHTTHQIKMTPQDLRDLRTTLQDKRDAIKPVKIKLDRYFEEIPHNYDKVLLVDLCRLFVCHDLFTPELTKKFSKKTLFAYKDTTDSLLSITTLLKGFCKDLFHDLDFKQWRAREEKNFLKEKRIEEKKAKTYAKPYLDYLDQQESQQFQQFWEEHKWPFLLAFLLGVEEIDPDDALGGYLFHLNKWRDEIAQGAYQETEWIKSYHNLKKAVENLPPAIAISYLQTMRSYHELTRPLYGRYRNLRHSKSLTEKDLAAAFYPLHGFGYGRSHAYRQSTIQGSLFKLVTAYEALAQTCRRHSKHDLTLKELNPLVIVDNVFTQGGTRYVGTTKEGKPIPQLYKGGRIPRSLAHQNIGEVDLIKAIEVSSNPYFALLAGDYLEKPEDLSAAARLFSYGSPTGIELPGEIAGKVPADLASNRTGLYAMAIGQHSLVVTPLQTAVMLSSIANGGKVLKPQIIGLMAGREHAHGVDPICCLPIFPFQEQLALVGIDFPLFTAISQAGEMDIIKQVQTEVKRELFMPKVVRNTLLKGLYACMQRSYQENLSSLTRLYQQNPEAIQDYTEMRKEMFGKTSTSEVVEMIDLDLNEGTNMYTHVWFGCLSCQKEFKEKKAMILKDEFGKPELVVVVYLRYGGYGKEAAPLSAQIIKKWREIKRREI